MTKRNDKTRGTLTPVRQTVRQALAAMLALTLGLTGALAANAGRDLVMPFSQLGQREAVMLKRGHSRHQIPFALRADEVVASAVLKLDLAQSPMLAGRAGALEVRVNGELVSRLDPSTTASSDSRGASYTIPIDPRLVIDQNELTVQFAEPIDCASADSAGLWAQIALTSTLNLVMAPLPLANDLSLLPAPFFDPRDPRRNELTLVLSPRASEATLQAAGNVASWFGALSAYRGVRIQARDRLPGGNAIVLATPEDAPPGVALPPIAGALVTLAAHPDYPQRKVLYLLGRDGEELRRAADALVRGQLPGHGSSALIDRLTDAPPRRAWDAPNWTPTHRPVRLDELISTATLATRDAGPLKVHVPMRLPPDLFSWRERKVLVDLRMRYEARPDDTAVALRVRFNGENQLDELLDPGIAGRWLDNLQRSVRGERDEALTRSVRRSLRIPVATLGTQSYARLDVTLQPGATDDAVECQRENGVDTALDRPRSVVDGASTIDFSDTPHFLPMPDLAAFANTTHPYTRLADLAETAVVLPDEPSREDVDTFLTLMGRAGEATGLAARLIRVVHTRGVGQVADRDLIVIGSAGNQRLFADWASAMPFRDLAAVHAATSVAPKTALSMSIAGLSPADWALPDSLRWLRTLWQHDGLAPQETLAFRGTDLQAALVGFESPLASNRSVVGLMATTPAALSFITDALLDSRRLAQIHGHISLFDESGRITVFSAEPTYASGDLPWLSWIRWKLSDRPVLLWAVLMLGILVLSAVIYVLLQRHAMRRHAGAST
ncbi:cellulose biosynthesis cyclic di-GMP-binding regulatory protein BcsB [Sphaerotilus sp.]|uniref:cellulose biosynthesis cyclic di-GMP-binding regulatory protein BcsB n=1 Tax=Sphaerotilus sp. TaxID=2093942 RepID=UPI00286E0523|nr:cellulose biosynthesis cyclic di-GMP-binding regulatory protein BcsB [Sphaerotilus sp.]